MKRNNVIAISIVVLVILFVIANSSHKVDWSPTYDENDTKPLDTKVFFDQMAFWFEGKSAKKIHTTFYEYDQYLRMQPVDSIKNYISISRSYNIDETSFESLMDYVAYGNEAFISANTFPYFLKDTLGFDTDFTPTTLQETPKTLFLKYTNDSLQYTSKVPSGLNFIKDTVTFKKLGYIKSEEGKELTNFVGIPFFDGIFYIHTTPEVFTNYQMLEADDATYVSTAISYLPKVPFLWDKAIKINPEFDQSPLRFIKSKESLRWAWNILLLTLVLFIIFKAKRKQRIIPIKEPLKNTTTEFVHTVSNLHYEAQDYDGIIKKKIIHFLEAVRSKYHLSTAKLDDNFVKRLALKSGNSVESVQRLVTLIIKMKSHTFRTKEPLTVLNKEIEEFYKKDKR
jgi:hypothetical protein